MNNGTVQEAVKLVYRDNDLVYVNINGLHKISKYKGKDGITPTLHKLGSSVWQNTKQRTKKQVKDIAKDLIALYAERRAQSGFQFSPDTYMQNELEASFFFEDTPDQAAATEKVKEAMEAPYPMDMPVINASLPNKSCEKSTFPLSVFGKLSKFKVVTLNI